MVDAGYIKGDELGRLDLSEDMIRMLVIFERIVKSAVEDVKYGRQA